MKAFLSALSVALHEFLTSKKVITAVVTVIVSYLVKNPSLQPEIIALGVTVILGFAASDVGKSKAIIEAAVPKPAPILTLVPMPVVSSAAAPGSGGVVMVPFAAPPPAPPVAPPGAPGTPA